MNISSRRHFDLLVHAYWRRPRNLKNYMYNLNNYLMIHLFKIVKVNMVLRRFHLQELIY